MNEACVVTSHKIISVTQEFAVRPLLKDIHNTHPFFIIYELEKYIVTARKLIS